MKQTPSTEALCVVSEPPFAPQNTPDSHKLRKSAVSFTTPVAGSATPEAQGALLRRGLHPRGSRQRLSEIVDLQLPVAPGGADVG